MDAQLDQLDARAVELGARTTTLELDTRPGAYLSESEAVSRFQDYLFLHLIGEHEAAAEGFFALVTTGVLADAGLHRDAEWYLAESLAGLGNYKTAASRFQVIVDDPDHPFRDDAVRRLLELYATSGDKDAFSRMYEAEIASGRVKPTGLITYSLAKAFYQQGNLDQAKSYFGQVPAENAWYGRARYFLGAILVKEGDLDAAKTEFKTVSDLSIQTAEDRMVHDLALLGLGRIAYHTGDYLAASEAYNLIGGDSQYQADKLYEIVWTSIRREKWRDALNNVEIFLLAYPEHEYSAQLRLLQGHLNFQEKNWTDARGSYEQVITEYTPVQARFDALSRPGSDADAAVRSVLEVQTEQTDLPPYAVSMMKADPELSRAMKVFRDLDQERSDIEASERLIEELESFIQGSGAIGSFERTRTNSLVDRMEVVDARLDLLSVEQQWLGSVADNGVAADLPALIDRRQALETRSTAIAATVEQAATALSAFERGMGELHAEADNARRDASDRQAQIDAARSDLTRASDDVAREQLVSKITTLESEVTAAKSRQEDADRKMASLVAPNSADAIDVTALGTLYAEIDSLASDFRSIRPSQPGLVAADRIDSTHRSLDDMFARLTGVYDAIGQTETTEVTGIKQRFDAEVVAVAQERVDYDTLLGNARSVSLEITRQGFGRLEDFFADSILKADMGIVDVFWAEKLEIADELDRVREERELQLAELERRFKLIREKMGDEE
ncbi:MAG: tetratricopeptide repeat protein [Myxococcota bacterium]